MSSSFTSNKRRPFVKPATSRFVKQQHHNNNKQRQQTTTRKRHHTTTHHYALFMEFIRSAMRRGQCKEEAVAQWIKKNSDERSVETYILETYSSFNLTWRDKVNKQTLLHIACIHNRLSVIIFLLKHQRFVDPNAVDEDGYTPLEIACVNENLRVMRILFHHKKVLEYAPKSQIELTSYFVFQDKLTEYHMEMLQELLMRSDPDNPLPVNESRKFLLARVPTVQNEEEFAALVVEENIMALNMSNLLGDYQGNQRKVIQDLISKQHL